MMIKPIALHKEIVDLIGNYDILINHREGSNRTGVWKIRSQKDQRFYYVKTYTRKNRWHPEVFAYKNWIHAIHPYAPELIKAFSGEDYQGILITALDGKTMTESNLTKEKEEKAFYKAGELTRILHTQFSGGYFGRPDCNGDPIELFYHHDPIFYLEKTFYDLSKKLKEINCFSSDVSKKLHWALTHIEVLQDVKAVPVSWDSSPYNWLVNDNGEFVGMIDFENMLWGIPSDHFTILYERYFPNAPWRKEAFFNGYGLDIIKDMEIQIKIACIKMGLADLIYGKTHNDERIYNLGLNLLETI